MVLLNIPYYFLSDLHHMAGFVRVAKHSLSLLTHHGLIKLIILRTLAQQNITWEQFTAQVQELAPLPGIPIEEKQVHPQLGGHEAQQEDQSPSNIDGGGDETGSEDQPGAQAEHLREDVHKNPMEELNNRLALTAEGEIGTALDVATIEPEDDRAMVME